jgi:hypothetical protein
MDISLEKLESNIIFYKNRANNYVGIKNPKLPIIISPVLTSLAAHLCFDGCLPNNGHGMEYSQKNLQQIDNFKEKVDYCFGKTYSKLGKDSKNIPKLRYPRFIGDSLKGIYGFESFGTFDCFLPSSIFRLSKEHKIALLASAIVDEGHIHSEYVQLLLSNKRLIEDLRNLCVYLGYNCSPIRFKLRNEPYNKSYYFYMKSVKKFYEDYLKVNKQYPLISLTFKEHLFKFVLETKNYKKGKSNLKSRKNREEQIISILSKRLTSNEIAEKLRINPRSVRRILLHLLKQNQIKRIKIEHDYFYFI